MTDSLPHVDDTPFGPALASGALYIGATLQQRIDLLEHLLEFGRQLIVLSGPAGSGKSTLLSAISAAVAQRWNCVSVQGGPALQARALLAQIADALDVDLSADSEPRMAQTMLRLRLSVLERAGKLTVILVDDADKLPPDAVAALVALARSEDQAAEARVLMTADQDHAGLLANLQRDRPQHGLVHVVEIPPLTESQTGDFIAQRLAVADLALSDYFSAAELQRIATAAAGNPARVVALARQHFATRAAARDGGARRSGQRKPSRGAGLPAFKWPRITDRRLLPLFLLPPLLALGAWWFLREETPDPPADETAAIALDLPRDPSPADAPTETSSPTPPERPAAEVAEAAPPPVDAPTPDPRLADNGDQELIEIVLPDEPVAPGPADAAAPPPVPAVPPPAAAPTPPVAAAPEVPPPTPMPAPAQQAAPSAAPAMQPTPVAKPMPPPLPKPAAKPTPKPPAQPTPRPPPKPTPPPVAAPRVTGFSADWLLKQPRTSYTLQLAGVRDRAAAVRFIQRHGLSSGTTILSTTRDGQAWYVLVHGYYPTRQAAVAAAARLPPAVKKEVQPWARTIGDLAKLPR